MNRRGFLGAIAGVLSGAAISDPEPMSSEDTFTDEYNWLKPAFTTRENFHNLIEDIEEDVHSIDARTEDPDTVFNVTKPPYNAVGDGSTDDHQAIQDAFNDAGDLAEQSDGSVGVCIPTGVYWVEDEPTFRTNGSNVTIYGDGASSVIKPSYDKPDGTARSEYDGQNNAMSIGGNGSGGDSAENVTVRDLHIDGTEAQWGTPLDDDLEDDPPIVYNQWCRLDMRHIDGLNVHNITGESLSHLIYHRYNERVNVSNIRLKDGFCPVHSIGCVEGNISNIVGDRVECIVDWASCEDYTLNNAMGTNGYRGEDEALDMGGSQNISISNVIGYDFPIGAQMKSEGGNPYVGYTFDNCHFYQVELRGYNLANTSGDDRRIDINNSIVEGVGEDGSVGVQANAGVSDVMIDNLRTYTEGPGLSLMGPERLHVSNSYFRSRDDLCIDIEGGSNPLYERPTLNNVRCNCRADSTGDRLGVITISGASRPVLNDVRVWSISPHRGVQIENCLMPDIDVKTSQTGAQGLVCDWSNSDYLAGTSEQIGAEITANIENHGMENGSGAGVRLIFDMDSPSTVTDVDVDSTVRMTGGGAGNRRGDRIDQSGLQITTRGSVTELDDSVLNLKHKYVPVSIQGESNLGSNVELNDFYVAP